MIWILLRMDRPPHFPAAVPGSWIAGAKAEPPGRRATTGFPARYLAFGSKYPIHAANFGRDATQ
jgi:hypothetical protein